MEKPDHPQSHGRRRDYVTDILKKLPGAVHIDGESCLTATTASLLNTLAITQKASKYSDAYKAGMKGEKHLNTHADLVNSWTGRAWHQYRGDFWGPILMNLSEGGGWLSLDEIFDTRFEHRFVPKPPTEEESWSRQIDVRDADDDDPAIMLYKGSCQSSSGWRTSNPSPNKTALRFRQIESNCCTSSRKR
jgi:hypothetical protein